MPVGMKSKMEKSWDSQEKMWNRGHRWNRPNHSPKLNCSIVFQNNKFKWTAVDYSISYRGLGNKQDCQGQPEEALLIEEREATMRHEENEKIIGKIIFLAVKGVTKHQPLISFPPSTTQFFLKQSKKEQKMTLSFFFFFYIL